MGLMDILQQYTNTTAVAHPNIAHEDFDEVARDAPPEILGQGVADRGTVSS